MAQQRQMSFSPTEDRGQVEATRYNTLGGNEYGKPPKLWGGVFRVIEVNNNNYSMNYQFDLYLEARNEEASVRVGQFYCLCIDSLSANNRTSAQEIKGTQPDGTQITSNLQCELKIKGILTATHLAYKFHNLASNSLISLPMLAHSGCNPLNREDVLFTKHSNTIMEKYRERQTGLWRMA